ncbi:Gfo/Idh/MocA family protein [Mucisphaera sp.]|uniref:Gfo/Idh/MocA family protein n=1 Tax=Mucisphaera sp. TaxID=2913024 RepID=UPI003D0AD18E
MITPSNNKTQPIRIGIVGLGRSGFNIHAKWLATLRQTYTVAAVTDPDDQRCQEAVALHDCTVYPTFEALNADDTLDAIVIASPNLHHEDQTCAALEAGHHVIVEKPLALTVAGADRMMETAERTGRLLAPFQNRRFEPHFRKVQELLASGRLGRPIQIRIEWSQFTRRWDWQTLKSKGGGSLHNHCAHLLDHALELFGPGEPEVFVDMQRALSIGDAEDHIKIILHGEGHPTIDIESSSCCIYPEDRWHIWATAGGLRGTTEQLEWRWIDTDKLPHRDPDEGPAEGRVYQREEYEWHVEQWSQPVNTPPHTAIPFYRDFESALRRGTPLTVTPESVRRQIAVLDRCHELTAC